MQFMTIDSAITDICWTTYTHIMYRFKDSLLDITRGTTRNYM